MLFLNPMDKILFSKWTRWDDRLKLPNIHLSGVYLLSTKKTLLGSTGMPTEKSIIYIGETTKNSLNGRLQQFHRSAFLGRDGHSGAKTYRSLIGGTQKTLIVSAMGISKTDELKKAAYIKYIERKLLMQYINKHGVKPKCNQY